MKGAWITSAWQSAGDPQGGLRCSPPERRCTVLGMLNQRRGPVHFAAASREVGLRAPGASAGRAHRLPAAKKVAGTWAGHRDATCFLRHYLSESSSSSSGGIAPSANKLERSLACTASPRKSGLVTWKIFCMVRRSDECVRKTWLANGRPFTLG